MVGEIFISDQVSPGRSRSLQPPRTSVFAGQRVKTTGSIPGSSTKRAAEMRPFFVGLDGWVDCWVRTALGVSRDSLMFEQCRGGLLAEPLFRVVPRPVPVGHQQVPGFAAKVKPQRVSGSFRGETGFECVQ